LKARARPGAVSTVALPFERCVFVNCPFDDDFLPILHAMLFAIHDCGFVARIAVEDAGTNETRLDKIVRLIEASKYSIHDISRVELTRSGALPRFNMAFECGLALGAIRFGRARGGDFLLMSGEAHQDQKTLSDLAGQDSGVHGNDPERAVAAVRAFLSAKDPLNRTRGPDAIWKRYERFGTALPRLAKRFELRLEEVLGFDFLRDYLRITADWIKAEAVKVGRRR
jgi:hypothetical protein